MTYRRFLVVGTRPASLGEAIANKLPLSEVDSLFGAPVFKTEHPAVIHDTNLDPLAYVPCDVAVYGDVRKALLSTNPTDVVCCAGINTPDYHTLRSELVLNMRLQLQSNTWGPISLLTETLDFWKDAKAPITGFNFVMISSNSAHIARSKSAGYCASKAALSMAVRCIARAEAHNKDLCIWGYEPGWINDTPMSESVLDRLRYQGDSSMLHRIPGGQGISKVQLAELIVDDLAHPMRGLHGTMIRVDGGEQ